MIKMHYKILLLLFFLSSCQKEPMYVQLADQEMFSFANEVKQNNNLKLIGYGGGFLNRINSISLTFSGKQQLDLEESRFMFLSLSQRFLANINANEKIRPYLADYPFSAKNLDFAIFFPCYPVEETKYVTAVSISNTYNFDNDPVQVLYTVIDDKGEGRIVHVETYEKALERANLK